MRYGDIGRGGVVRVGVSDSFDGRSVSVVGVDIMFWPRISSKLRYVIVECVGS